MRHIHRKQKLRCQRLFEHGCCHSWCYSNVILSENWFCGFFFFMSDGLFSEKQENSPQFVQFFSS